MTNTILRMNATPLYTFLCLINAGKKQGETFRGEKILDCGAGRVHPPLVLFHKQRFDTWGIDISDKQIQKAKEFCEEKGTLSHLLKSDMRQIPFEDETFDYVYEHYSMCHLSKKDTEHATHEMYRVLKTGGLCFLGVISKDTWPKSSFGEESEPGQFWGKERDGALTLHSMFTDEKADQLVSGWEITSKEKRVIYLQEDAQETSIEAWMELHREVQNKYTQENWKVQYTERFHKFQQTILIPKCQKENGKMIKGINHITLAVKDVEKSFVFYKEILGLNPVVKWKNGAYLLASDFWVALNQDSKVLENKHPDYSHIAFSIERSNFEKLKSRLLKYGCGEWSKNKSEGESFYFLDPDGHKFEVHVGDLQSRLNEMRDNPWDTFEFY